MQLIQNQIHKNQLNAKTTYRRNRIHLHEEFQVNLERLDIKSNWATKKNSIDIILHFFMNEFNPNSSNQLRVLRSASFDCFIKHFAPMIFTPFIEKLTSQTVASLSVLRSLFQSVFRYPVLASGIVGVQVQINKSAIVATLAHLLCEESASLEQNKVDEALI